MKIIAVDTYKRKIVADVLVAENINERFGGIIVEFLNSGESVYTPYSSFFKLVADDYKLWRGMEELV